MRLAAIERYLWKLQAMRSLREDEYVAIDHRISYRAIQDELDDFRQLARAVAMLF
ncbi:MAG: hypothetical protein HY303_14575 [Candidatus Wallbacteria bacterium]|nr:hypothetical protein [Candidatus Wallbacteria bacterium]